jgi:hypothetical protein
VVSRHRRRAVAAGLTAVVLALAPQLARAADTVAFTIADPRVTESSGLARDTARQAYWTVNDSGDSGRVFAVDSSGKTLGTASFRAAPVDVEALAMHDRRLYVADIGDNTAKRQSVTVYFFDNLTPGNGTATYMAYDFAYPDGAHDAETLLVDPAGRLYVVTKEAKGGIYAAPTAPSRTAVNRLEKVGDAPAYVTDGVVLPDGRIALRTYVSVEILDPTSYQVVARASAPLQPQGESIAVDLAGDGLLLGSEGKGSAVYAVRVPDALGAVPSASASPPAASASATADADPGGDTQDPGGTSDTSLPDGTLGAVGLAALVAVVAGVVVGLARSRR